MRGRKSKPEAIKRLTGNPGRRKKKQAATFAPSPLTAQSAPAPEWLDAQAKAIWTRLAPHLGLVLTAVDLEKFSVFCQTVADYVRWKKLVAYEGEFIESPNGMKMAHPALSQIKQAAQLIAKYGSDFGLDPVSRSRITATPEAPKDGQVSAEQEFFGMRLAQ